MLWKFVQQISNQVLNRFSFRNKFYLSCWLIFLWLWLIVSYLQTHIPLQKKSNYTELKFYWISNSKRPPYFSVFNSVLQNVFTQKQIPIFCHNMHRSFSQRVCSLNVCSIFDQKLANREMAYRTFLLLNKNYLIVCLISTDPVTPPWATAYFGEDFRGPCWCRIVFPWGTWQGSDTQTNVQPWPLRGAVSSLVYSPHRFGLYIVWQSTGIHPNDLARSRRWFI